MGLFTRFRTPSNPSSSSDSNNNRPTTPGPCSTLPPPGSPSHSLGRSHTEHSINSYQDESSIPTPRPKEKGLFGWKGKSKADVQAGRPYEDQRSPPRPAVPSKEPVYGDRAEKRITAIFHPHPSQVGSRPITPPAILDQYRPPPTPLSPQSDRTIQNSPTKQYSPARPMSNEFIKDGGVLGRLTFEKSDSVPRNRSPDKRGMKRDVPSWLAGSGSEEDGEYLSSGPSQPPPPSAVIPPPSSVSRQSVPKQEQPQPPQSGRWPPVPRRRSSVLQLNTSRSGSQDGSAISDGEDEPDTKKGKFWAVKGRRASKAGEVEVKAATGSRASSPTPRKPPPSAMRPLPQPGSPTPRKASLPPIPPQKSHPPTSPTRSLTSNDQPVLRANPPPNLRRPSSSFFSNPFTRTTSRGSVFTDVDSPLVDDGSFQLKGFRHVSGMSHMDTTPAEGSTSALGLGESQIATSPVVLNSPEDTWDPAPPVRPSIIARPSSSASIRTFESGAESPKVSVAAFKKGIRRPSEIFAEGSKPSADDDDDVPLAVLSHKGFTRAKSSLSLSDQVVVPEVQRKSPIPKSPSVGEMNKPIPTQVYTPIPRVNQLSSQPPSREPSPRPNTNVLPQAPRGHNRNGSGGFVLRSAHSSRSITSLNSLRDGTGPNSPMSFSSRPTSPIVPGEEAEEVIQSPAKSPSAENGGSYFVIPNPSTSKSEDVPLRSPAMVERNSNLPSAPTSTSDKPKQLPLPLEPGLHDLVLPPRPSDTPDEPISARPYPRARMSSGQSQLPRPTDISRRISNFLAPSLSKAGGDNEDGFDPALVVDSMAAFSEEPAPMSRSHNGPRPSLQARLDQAAAASGKPNIPRIETDLGSGPRVLGVMSPASDRTVTPSVDARPGSSFSNAKTAPKEAQPKRGRERGRTISGKQQGKRDGWSSSDESEDEQADKTIDGHQAEEAEEMARSSFRKPIGPRAPQTALPIQSNAAPAPPVLAPTITAPAKKVQQDDSGSSSEEESLAQIKKKASRSSLALNTYTSSNKRASQPPTAQRGFRSPSSPNLSSPPGQTIPLHRSPPTIITSPIPQSPPKSSQPPSKPNKSLSPPPVSRRSGLPHSASSSTISSQTGPRRSPLSQSLSSTQLSQDASPPRTMPAFVPSPYSAPRTASPASSQSGLTGDSVLQPVTPGESSAGVGSKANLPSMQKHGRTASRDSSQPSNGGAISSSTSMASMSPSTEERQRRLSQGTMPPLGPTAMPANMPFSPNMDPAMIRNMMKQQWQAQFMAAAYQAAEEEWERASSVGGMAGGSESGQSAFSSFGAPGSQVPGMPMGMPMGMSMGMGMPMPYGYGFPPGMGMPPYMPPQGYGMPPGMGFPGFPMQSQGPHGGGSSAGQGQGGGMYSYGAGAQSVYGGDFGPSVSQQQQFHPQFQQYQHQQQMFQQQPMPSQSLRNPIEETSSSASAGGPIRQRPRMSSKVSSQPLQHIQENSASSPNGYHGQSTPSAERRQGNRASSYHIGSGAGGGPKGGMSSSASVSNMSSYGDSVHGNGGMMAPPPPPTSWRRNTSEWGGEGSGSASAQDKRKSRGGFAS